MPVKRRAERGHMASATIDWCEVNYAVLSWIAEFWNTFSSLAILLPAMFGLHIAKHRRYESVVSLQFCLLVSVGIGTAWFHASLTYVGQMVDELAMLAGGVNWVI
eukprot:6468811-Amphidinium_carterae.3